MKGNNAKGLYTGMIILDLQKAFDTVDHTILCDKLEQMGVVTIDWFKSYMSDRQQVISINGATSSPGLVTWGSPRKYRRAPAVFVLC